MKTMERGIPAAGDGHIHSPGGFPGGASKITASEGAVARGERPEAASGPIPARLDVAYHPAIDAMRAFAVLAVLYAHFATTLPTHVGHYGVRVFFVISGYLITRNLLQLKQSSRHGLIGQCGTFYARRILRLLPAYYTLVLVTFLLGADEDAASPLWFLLHLSNFLYATRNEWNPWVLGHSWTLSMEEQFYLFWPLIVLAFRSRVLRAFCWAGVIVSLLFRFWWPITAEPGLMRDLLPPASFDALAGGAMIAAYIDGIRRVARPVLRGLFVASAFVVLATNNMPWLLGDHEWLAWFWYEVSLLPLAALAIILAVLQDRSITWIGRFAPLLYLGRISYGIYLFHFIVLWSFLQVPALSDLVSEGGPLRFILVGATTIAVAAASHHFLETPINRLKDRFPYR